MWDYDEKGGMYFTELGLLCANDSSFNLAGYEWTSPYTGKTYPLSGTFNDGCIQINNTTLSKDMVNPDGNGVETFNKDTWASVVTATTYPIQEDWRTVNNAVLADEYMEAREDEYGDKLYVLMPDIPYSESERPSDLMLKWNNCAKTVKDYSWRAIYAKSDAEFNYHVNEMKRLCKQYGFDDCLVWCEQEAAQKWQLTQNIQ
jgi:multiple sugar transport system substrate-binding protein/putative aldouronate transport system substrate-binding protein